MYNMSALKADQLDNDFPTLPRVLAKYSAKKSLDAIKVDPNQHYIYGCPREYMDSPRYDRSHQKRLQLWPSLANFDPDKILYDIRNYINMWELGPSFSASIVSLERKKKEKFGTCHFIDVFFAKRQISDTRAVVHFHVYESRLLPKYYPIMVTYQFENETKEHYTLGMFRETNMTFQRPLLEKILASKAPRYVLPDCSFSGSEGSENDTSESSLCISQYDPSEYKYPYQSDVFKNYDQLYLNESHSRIGCSSPSSLLSTKVDSDPLDDDCHSNHTRLVDEFMGMKGGGAPEPFNLSYYTGSPKSNSRSLIPSPRSKCSVTSSIRSMKAPDSSDKFSKSKSTNKQISDLLNLAQSLQVPRRCRLSNASLRSTCRKTPPGMRPGPKGRPSLREQFNSHLKQSQESLFESDLRDIDYL